MLRFSKLQLEKEWMWPVVREAMIKHFKLARAHEEMARLNVEVRRLRKSIQDEDTRVKHTAERLEEQGLQLLAGELHRRERLRSEINHIHL